VLLLLGSLAIGATAGWLCGMLLSPRPAYGRAEIVIFGSMIFTGAALGVAFNIRAMLGFVVAALVFYFFHAVWRLRRKTSWSS